jgi:hypothetical protein
MTGQKIRDARLAVLRLIERLTDNDLLAVVAYSNGVSTVWPTRASPSPWRWVKWPPVPQNIILLSAPSAWDWISTKSADHGAGRYYFLEDPRTFAQVFDKELQATRTVAASGLEIRIPQAEGVHLVNAGGYPITTQDNVAVIRPGDLLSGQKRSLYMTFQVPTDKERSFHLGAFKARFMDNGVPRRLTHGAELSLACLDDQKAVMASIDKAGWGEQVVREDYSQLMEAVAEAIREGQKQQALTRLKAITTGAKRKSASWRTISIWPSARKETTSPACWSASVARSRAVASSSNTRSKP